MSRIFLTTTGTLSSFTISDLGIFIQHPSTNYELTNQFYDFEIFGSPSLQGYINNNNVIIKDQFGNTISNLSAFSVNELILNSVSSNTLTSNTIFLNSIENGFSTPEGTIYWNDNSLKLRTEFSGLTIEVGKSNYEKVKNLESDILKGQVVYVSGADGGILTVSKAINTAHTVSDIFGIAANNIPSGSTGYISTYGNIYGLNTEEFSGGDFLYLGSTFGSITNIKPSSPESVVLVGYCISADSTNGIILSNPQMHVDLDTITEVEYDNNPQDGQVLLYTSSTQTFVNRRLPFSSLIFTGHTHTIDQVDNLFGSLNTKANLSGATFTGSAYIPTLSAQTIYSGTTDLYNIFATSRSSDITRVQGGTNIFTGGTTEAPTINITSATLVNLSTSGTNVANSLSANTLSGGTIYSGSTNLYDIFLTSTGANDITRIQPGTNIFTGGTTEAPTINITSATLVNLSTSGTNVANSLSATTLSGGTIYSGSTNLYDIFLTTNDGNDITRVQGGTNIFTGGTTETPTINITSATLANLSTSGINVANLFSATTLSGGTIYSGRTNLYDIFALTGDNRFYDLNVLNVSKNPGYGEFLTIEDALNSITDASDTNRYVVKVAAGVYQENQLFLNSFISVRGETIQGTVVEPIGDHDLFISSGDTNEISFLTIANVTSGNTGVKITNTNGFTQLHKVSFSDCDTCIAIGASTHETEAYLEYVDFNGEMTYGLKVESSNGFRTFCNTENFYTFPTNSNFIACSAKGINSFLTLNTCGLYANYSVDGPIQTGSTGIHCENGSVVTVMSSEIYSFGKGVYNVNNGTGCTIQMSSVIFNNNEIDIQIDSPLTTGSFLGTADSSKILIVNTNTTFLPGFNDIGDGGGLVIVGDLKLGDTVESITNVSDIIFNGTMGLISGGEITIVSGNTISVSSGTGYLDDMGILKYKEWNTTTLTLPSGQTNYVYVNESGVVTSSVSRQSNISKITLGRVITDTSNVELIDYNPTDASHSINKNMRMFVDVFGSLFEDGCIVSESSSPRQLDITSGEYYLFGNQFLPTGATGATFTTYHRNGVGGYVKTSGQTTVSNTQFDNGSGTLSALTTSYYTKHSLYVNGEGANQKYLLIYGQSEYAIQQDAENAGLPTPPSYFIEGVVKIASIIVQQGNTNIVKIIDERPRPLNAASSQSVVTVHGDLSGLEADDHLQYLRTDGSRELTGNLNLGTYNIISAGTVNGVTVQSHASRHQHGGQDEIATYTPAGSAIPKADTNARLDSWISTASTSTAGLVKLSVSPTASTHPIVVGINDPILGKSKVSSTDSYGYLFEKLSGGTNIIINSGNTGSSEILSIHVNPQFNSLSATTLSGETIYSGSTSLYDIFATIPDQNDITRVQNGTNVFTGGTELNPTINITSATLANLSTSGTNVSSSFSATTLSAGTFFSGSTSLYNIFATIPDQNDITRIQGGTNVFTGGTSNAPSVNITSATLANLSTSGTNVANSFSATTLSGGTIFSGSTNLQNTINLINGQLSTKANLSGATFTGGIVAPSLSATTLSGGTIYSGSTNLQNTINLINGQLSTKANLSGTTFTGNIFAPTVSASTFISGATNLYNVFPFGQNFQSVHDNFEVSFADANKNIVTQMTTPSLTSALYRIEIYCELQASTTTMQPTITAEYSSTIFGTYVGRQSNVANYIPLYFVGDVTISGIHTIYLYYQGSNTSTGRVRNRKISIHKIS